MTKEIKVRPLKRPHGRGQLNFEVFRKDLPELLEISAGDWAVYRDGKLLGVYGSKDEEMALDDLNNTYIFQISEDYLSETK